MREERELLSTSEFSRGLYKKEANPCWESGCLNGYSIFRAKF